MDIIICAGGQGNRMSQDVNPRHSKPLIEINGTPLIELLIINAVSSGFRRFFISVNNNNSELIEQIVHKFDYEFKLKITGPNFASVPSLFLDDLDDTFLIVCGHDYIPVSHFKSLIDKAKNFDLVETAYRNIGNETANKRRIIIDGGNYKPIDLNRDIITDQHIYVRNPYIINQQIVEDVIKDDFERSAGWHIYNNWKNNRYSVGHVFTDIPVEFDTNDEYQRLMRYIERDYLK